MKFILYIIFIYIQKNNKKLSNTQLNKIKDFYENIYKETSIIINNNKNKEYKYITNLIKQENVKKYSKITNENDLIKKIEEYNQNNYKFLKQINISVS